MAFFTAICLQAMSYCRLRNKSTLLVVWGFALVMSISKPLLEAILGSTIFVSQFGDGIEASPLSHLFGVLLAVAVFKTITFWETAWKWIGCNHSFRNRKLSETSTF